MMRDWPICRICAGQSQIYYTRRCRPPVSFTRCCSCGSVQVDQLPDHGALKEYYETAYTGSEFMEERNQSLADDYFNVIRQEMDTLLPGNIMEVGSAAGYLSEMIAAYTGRKVFLVDQAAPSSVRVGSEFRRGFLCEETLEPGCALVFGGHVIEHVRDPAEWLGFCAQSLQPGGKLILLTPNARSWKFALFRMAWSWSGFSEHLHLLSCQALSRLLTEQGFEIDEMVVRNPCAVHRPRVSLCGYRWLKLTFLNHASIPKWQQSPLGKWRLRKYFEPLDTILEAAGLILFGSKRRDEIMVRATLMSTKSDADNVSAVVVTHNRLSELKRCLTALESQTRRPDSIVVVDNGSSDGTSEWLAAREDLIVIRQDNLGSGGGQNRGIEAALRTGAEWIWTMDDDGEAAVDCLERLLAGAVAGGLGLANAAVINRDNHAELSFRIQGRYDREVLHELAQEGIAYGELAPFNGTLIRSSVVRRIGNVHADLFIWGDEREYYLRAKQAEEQMGIVTAAHFYHPRTRMQFFPILGGRYEVAYPEQKNRGAYLFRNIGYHCRMYSPVIGTLRIIIKYSLYYIEAPVERLSQFRILLRYFLEGLLIGVRPLAEFQKSVMRSEG